MDTVKIYTISDIVMAAASMLTAIFTGILLLQVYLAAKQLKQTATWNRLNATFMYFSHDKFVELQNNMSSAFRGIKKPLIDFDKLPTKPLDDDQVNAIWNNRDAFLATKHYLNYLEVYSLAVNREALDDDSAYHMMKAVITRTFLIYEPFILKIRKERDDSLIHIELDNLAEKWKGRLKQEQLAKKRKSGVGSAVPPSP